MSAFLPRVLREAQAIVSEELDREPWETVLGTESNGYRKRVDAAIHAAIADTYHGTRAISHIEPILSCVEGLDAYQVLLNAPDCAHPSPCQWIEIAFLTENLMVLLFSWKDRFSLAELERRLSKGG